MAELHTWLLDPSLRPHWSACPSSGLPCPPPKPGGLLLSEARWGTGDKSWRATTAVALSPTQPRNCPFCHPSGSWTSQRLEGPPYPVRGFVSNFSFLEPTPTGRGVRTPPPRPGPGGVGVWGGDTRAHFLVTYAIYGSQETFLAPDLISVCRPVRQFPDCRRVELGSFSPSSPSPTKSLLSLSPSPSPKPGLS